MLDLRPTFPGPARKLMDHTWHRQSTPYGKEQRSRAHDADHAHRGDRIGQQSRLIPAFIEASGYLDGMLSDSFFLRLNSAK
jgi:hypothetical protein